MVKAIIYNNQVVSFDNEEIVEMINNIDVYAEADNLPKWLAAADECEFTKESMVGRLTELLDGDNTVDVRYDLPDYLYRA